MHETTHFTINLTKTIENEQLAIMQRYPGLRFKIFNIEMTHFTINLVINDAFYSAFNCNFITIFFKFNCNFTSIYNTVIKMTNN